MEESLLISLKSKKDKYFAVKSGEFESGIMVKDVDSSNRIVTGFYNTINVLDSDMDIVRSGAYSKSFKEHGVNSSHPRKIKHCKDHDLGKVSGKIQVLEEKTIGDLTGAYFETKMSNTTLGNDELINYQEGIIDNHSFGFKYQNIVLIELGDGKNGTLEESDFNRNLEGVGNSDTAKENGYFFDVKEVEFYEGSSVAIGANQLTPFLGGKSKDGTKLKLIEKLELFEKQLRHGTQSDDMMQRFLLECKQLKQMVDELSDNEPSLKDTIIIDSRKDNDTQKAGGSDVNTDTANVEKNTNILLNI